MTDPCPTNAGGTAPGARVVLGRERLLGIPDICAITGLGEATASKLIRESGHAIRLHRRLYLLESSFFAWLKSQEQKEASAQ